MNTEIIKIYKELGETPLQAINKFREANQSYKDANMTYLGRLDPMAEGMLLILVGNTKEKDKYLSLDKSYEFEVLWGFETDTYDILGLVTHTGAMPQKLDFKMEKLLRDLREKKTQAYPPFSSKSFRGNYLNARVGKVDEVESKERGIKIFDLVHTDTRLVDGGEVLEEILRRIDLVQGDFRQEEIKDRWRSEFEGIKNEKFLISKFMASVSSGTYIRSLANEMGKKLNTSACAWSIKRTRVGEARL